MADNVAITPGSGATIATDELTINGTVAQVQRVKIALGADGVYQGDLTLANASARVQAQFTRPNDTTAYASGDAMANATSGASVLTFSNCAAAVGKGGLIVNAQLLDSAYQAPKGEFELWLFNAAPAGQNDNSAVAFSDAECANVVAVISFPSTYSFCGNAASGASGNLLYQPVQVNNNFKTNADANLYGVLVARNAYTPVAQEVITVTLNIVQD